MMPHPGDKEEGSPEAKAAKAISSIFSQPSKVAGERGSSEQKGTGCEAMSLGVSIGRPCLQRGLLLCPIIAITYKETLSERGFGIQLRELFSYSPRHISSKKEGNGMRSSVWPIWPDPKLGWVGEQIKVGNFLERQSHHQVQRNQRKSGVQRAEIDIGRKEEKKRNKRRKRGNDSEKTVRGKGDKYVKQKTEVLMLSQGQGTVVKTEKQTRNPNPFPPTNTQKPREQDNLQTPNTSQINCH